MSVQPVERAHRTTRQRPDWGLATAEDRAWRLLPLVLLCMVAVPGAMLLPQSEGGISWLAGAAVAMAVTGLIVMRFPWLRMSLAWRHLPVIFFCVGVFMLREGGGGSETGYGAVLLVLPVIWQGVYGRRIDLAVALGAVAVTLTLPIVMLDGYPGQTEFPRALLLLMVCLALGTLLQSLIAAIRRNDDILRNLLAISRRLNADDDPRATLCQAVHSLTGADQVVFVEGSEDDPVVVSSHGSEVASDPGHDAFAGIYLAIRTQEVQIEDVGKGRWLHIPLGRRTGLSAALTARWATDRPDPDQAILRGIMLLGSDAAMALERADLIETLDDQAHRDDLTGLPNRRSWDELLHHEISAAIESGRPLSIAIMDLDRFKAFNDAHGHLKGDELLREATEAWDAVLRGGDIMARWGGEEFAVLFPGAPSGAAISAIDRLRAVTPQGQTFSAGVAQYIEGDDAATLVAIADAAMYQAKSAGRNRIVRAERSNPSASWIRP